MSASWDDVRGAQVDVIIAASERVTEAEGWVAKGTATIHRLERELTQAREALENARKIRDERITKVAGFVKDYQRIGEGSE